MSSIHSLTHSARSLQIEFHLFMTPDHQPSNHPSIHPILGFRWCAHTARYELARGEAEAKISLRPFDSIHSKSLSQNQIKFDQWVKQMNCLYDEAAAAAEKKRQKNAPNKPIVSFQHGNWHHSRFDQAWGHPSWAGKGRQATVVAVARMFDINPRRSQHQKIWILIESFRTGPELNFYKGMRFISLERYNVHVRRCALGLVDPCQPMPTEQLVPSWVFNQSMPEWISWEPTVRDGAPTFPGK